MTFYFSFFLIDIGAQLKLRLLINLDCISNGINKLLRLAAEHTRLGKILRAPYREEILFFSCVIKASSLLRERSMTVEMGATRDLTV